MKINDNEVQDLRDSLVAKATRHLNGGAQARRDYGSWAESLAHDSIVELLEYEGTGNVFKLGATICERRCRDFKRDEINRREIENEFGARINRELTGQSAELLAEDPLDGLLRDEMIDRLEGLSPMLRWTVEQYYTEGRSAEDLATEQSTSVSTIHKRLQRARDIVKDNDDLAGEWAKMQEEGLDVEFAQLHTLTFDDDGELLKSDRITNTTHESRVKARFKERAAQIDARRQRQREQVALQERGMEWTLPNSKRLQLEEIT